MHRIVPSDVALGGARRTGDLELDLLGRESLLGRAVSKVELRADEHVVDWLRDERASDREWAGLEGVATRRLEEDLTREKRKTHRTARN